MGNDGVGNKNHGDVVGWGNDGVENKDVNGVVGQPKGAFVGVNTAAGWHKTSPYTSWVSVQ